jgi:hypothetical protein
MKTEMFMRALLVSVSIAAFLGIGGVVAEAAVCNVPSGSYPMIQDAVNDTNCSTINVAPGTYMESVTIARPLTLLGPNTGVSWSGTRGPEAVVTSAATTFNLTNGQNVTIDGFTINGDFGVYVSGSTTGTVIQNNIITGVSRALTLDSPGSAASVLNNDLLSNVRSLHVSGGPYTNLKVNGDRFSGAAASPGIFFSGALANSISGFEFKNNQVLHYANIASNISAGTVSGNTFDVNAPGALNLQIDLHDSTVLNNTFDGNGTTACLQLFGSQFGLVPSDHVNVYGNSFSGCNVYGIQLSPDIHHIYITNNVISTNSEGVNTRDVPPPWDVTGKEIHINFNNITGNALFGVRNGEMGTLDAQCNWWGDSSGPGPVGPGSGDRVSINVDFTPWLIAPAPGGKCLGGAPSTPGKVTGGGQIEGDPVFSVGGVLLSLPALVPSLTDPQSAANFGFVVQAQSSGTPNGNLEYNDKGADVRIKATSISGLFIVAGTCGPNTHATFTGMAQVIRSTATTTESFTVEVDDCGQPGTADTFGISTATYSNGPRNLVGGNIKIQ